MRYRSLFSIGESVVNSVAIKTIVLSGLFSIFLKIIGLFKEATLAKFFGVSSTLDIYLLATLCLLFFVGPIAGTIGTLLTQKYVELKHISSGLTGFIYRQSVYYSIILMFLFLMVIFGILNFPQSYNILPKRFQNIQLVEFLALAPIAIFSAVSVINGAVLTAEKRFKLFLSLPTVIPLSIIISLYLNISGNLFYSLLVGTLMGFGIELVLGTSLLFRLWCKFENDFKNRAMISISKMKSGFFPLFSASILLSGCVVIDQIMGLLAGEGGVSIVNFGSRVPLGLISIVSIIWIVLYPIFSELIAKGEDVEVKRIYLRFIVLCLVLLLPLCLIISIFSEDLIKLIFQHGAFDDDDTKIVALLQIFYLLYIPFYTICFLSVRVANSYQSQNVVLLCNALTLGMNVILNLAFIKIFGVVGIAAATLVSYILLSCFWFLVVMKKYFRF